MKEEGITLFAVNIGESDYRVQRFFKDYALNFRVLLDSDGQAADNYDVIGVPTYIFLNKTGRITSQENTLPADYKNLLLK
jgi:peroxiredoxin